MSRAFRRYRRDADVAASEPDVKALHIMARSHITEHFFDFASSSGINTDDHVVLMPAGSAEWTLTPGIMTVTPSNQLAWFAAYFRLARRSKRIFVHSLGRVNTIGLALTPWNLHKCYWLIWGGDLYAYRNRKSSLKSRAIEPLRRFVIKRIGHLVTYIQGDLDRVREWYGARGDAHVCLLYPGNTVQLPPNRHAEARAELRVLVGNSADPENGHLEVFSQLAQLDGSFIVLVPLAYGDPAHREIVLHAGKEYFGERFVPITELVPFDEYLEFLQTVDVAVFNHRRQQAMGNSISLLGMGKRLFIRRQTPQWDLFEAMGISVSAFDEGLHATPQDEEVSKSNSALIAERFSKTTLSHQWIALLD